MLLMSYFTKADTPGVVETVRTVNLRSVSPYYALDSGAHRANLCLALAKDSYEKSRCINNGGWWA